MGVEGKLSDASMRALMVVTLLTVSVVGFNNISSEVGLSYNARIDPLGFWFGDVNENISMMQKGELNPYRAFNEYLNSFLFSASFTSSIMQSVGDPAGYYLLCYIRDWIAGTIIYWGTAGIWHYVAYNLMGKRLFEDMGRPYPEPSLIKDQQMLAQASLFLYAALPVLSEYLIESGYTKTYFYVEEVGWTAYAIYFVAYLALVEIGIYWMHRTLHENKFCYNYIHRLHHTYDHHSTLTPWASIAFNPLDGIMQASPYVMCLFIVPQHYLTHMGLLFFSGVWATNIHDAVFTNFEPIMGAKYHTLHHTHFKVNYGQFFTFCDRFWGTLMLVDEDKFNKKAQVTKDRRVLSKKEAKKVA